MPYKNPEDKKRNGKKYYLKNKERIQQYKKDHPHIVTEESKRIQKIWRESESGKKSSTITRWRCRGLITEDYNKIYEYYLSIQECEHCGIELDEDEATRKCMDHCHQTGQFRNILCKTCNTIRK